MVRKSSFPIPPLKLLKERLNLEPYVREWKIGEQIDVNPLDCQAIAISLSMLGQQLQTDFEGEMNALLGIATPSHTASGK